MYYPTFGLAFEGLAWALMKGLVYGLALLVLLWVAGELAAWAIREMKRRVAEAQPETELPRRNRTILRRRRAVQ